MSSPRDTFPGHGPKDNQDRANSLAESVLLASDEQIFQEVKQAGQDPSMSANRVRSLLRQAVKSHRQKPLQDALLEYHRQVGLFQKQTYQLPESAQAKRELLASVFQRFPQMQNTFLTIQHREFKAMSDEDIESCLKQLNLLGVFDNGKK